MYFQQPFIQSLITCISKLLSHRIHKQFIYPAILSGALSGREYPERLDATWMQTIQDGIPNVPFSMEEPNLSFKQQNCS